MVPAVPTVPGTTGTDRFRRFPPRRGNRHPEPTIWEPVRADSLDGLKVKKSAPRTRSTFTPAQKAEALRLYGELGGAETARRTGISRSTLSNWAHQAGITAPVSELAERFKMGRGPVVSIDDLDLMPSDDELPTDLSDVDVETQIRRWQKIHDAATDSAYMAILNGDDMKAQRFGTLAAIARDKLRDLNQLRKPGAVVNDPDKLAAELVDYLHELQRRHPRPDAAPPQDEPGAEMVGDG